MVSTRSGEKSVGVLKGIGNGKTTSVRFRDNEIFLTIFLFNFPDYQETTEPGYFPENL